MTAARAREALGAAVEQLERWVADASERDEPPHLTNWIAVTHALAHAAQVLGDGEGTA